MALKRKRSDLSSSPFSTASYSTPCSPRDTTTNPPFPFPSTTDLNSRTMKRHRDNRPDEAVIYNNTYQRLFAAARAPPESSTLQSNTFVHAPPSTTPAQRQSSLHNFWSISSSTPPQALTVNEPAISTIRIACQDCDSQLLVSDTDVAMRGTEEDQARECEWNCRHCARIVCNNCAVVEVGAGRECLQCRVSTQKTWDEGVGWMSL